MVFSMGGRYERRYKPAKLVRGPALLQSVQLVGSLVGPLVREDIQMISRNFHCASLVGGGGGVCCSLVVGQTWVERLLLLLLF